MNKQIITQFWCGLILSFLLMSCSKMLDVRPKQSIDSGIALESPEAIRASLNSVYAYLQQASQYGLELIAIPELLADNTNHTNNPTSYYGQFRNQPGAHMGIWGSSYSAINEINNIIEVLKNPPAGVTDEFKESIEGQARFLRALFYHNLSKIYGYDPGARVEEIDYGSVPLVLHPVLRTDDITYPERATVGQIYRQIYTDLDSSYLLLEGKTIDASNPEYYASASAAAALLSRVALYNEDYDRAIVEASTSLVESEHKFLSNSNYIAGWRAVKLPESIFELAFHVGDLADPANASLRVTFTSRQTLSSTTFANRGNVTVAPDLYSKYASSDVRRGLFINGIGRNAGQTEITKYISRSGANHDNVPVIRVSEVILNRAEAYARSEQDELARGDLNKIRQRAGLSPVDASLAGDDLIDEILLQRRLELAFEGHRFFDLKRLGKDIIKPIGNVSFEEFRILAPLPYTEEDRNINLKQNFGY